MRMSRSIITIILTLALVISGTAVSFGASKPKTMTAYDQVIKSKSVMYCACGTRIVKVNLKNNKMTTIAKESKDIKAMRLYKGFVYYEVDALGYGAWLKRVKTSGKQKKTLAKAGWDKNFKTCSYVINGSTIYFKKSNWGEAGGPVYKMALAGKNKKKASGVSIKIKAKKTNAKGYKVIGRHLYINKETREVFTDYHLQKPNGKKLYLGKSIWIAIA